MKIINKVGFISAFSLIFAVNASYGLTSQDVGTLTGGVIGGVVGSQVFHGSGTVPGIIGGTIVGAVVGGAIGKSMDQSDRRNTQRAMLNTKVGKTKKWKNRKTGDQYAVTPVATYTNNQGQQCKKIQTTVTYSNGNSETTNTTMCLHDGKWFVIEQ